MRLKLGDDGETLREKSSTFSLASNASLSKSLRSFWHRAVWTRFTPMHMVLMASHAALTLSLAARTGTISVETERKITPSACHS
jgi:hypothetical protein